MVDSTLVREDDEPWLSRVHLILDEMVSRGNLVAGLRKAELQQLDETLTRLHAPSSSSIVASRAHDHEQETHENFRRGGVGDGECVQTGDDSSANAQMQFEPLHDWNSEEGLTGDRMIAFANSLDSMTPDWLSAAPLGQLEGFFA